MPVVAIDQGTTSCRAILLDEDATLLAHSQRPFTQHYPQSGWVEHNAMEIWEVQREVIIDVIKRGDMQASDITGMGMANQRETIAIWEKESGLPVAHAIVWQDRRGQELCVKLRNEGLEPFFRQRTGLLLDPYFSAIKLRWLLDHRPDIRERAESGELLCGTMDSWILYNITAGQIHATEPSNASRTLMMNLHTQAWDREILELLCIPESMLPRIIPSIGRLAETDPGIIGANIPIYAMLGDQQASLFGHGCFDPGMVKHTYGTGAFLVMMIGGEPLFADGILTTIAWQQENEKTLFALEGSIFVAGAAIEWLKEGLGLIATTAEVEDLAMSVKDTHGLYFVPALTGLGAPYWDPEVRGMMLGLSRGTRKEHLVRAALEAMVFQTQDVLAAMEATQIPIKELRLDGGAATNSMLMQLQADLAGVPVHTTHTHEVTALGAGMAAMVGKGTLTLDDVANHWKSNQIFRPSSVRDDVRQRWNHEWKKAVNHARGWQHS